MAARRPIGQAGWGWLASVVSLISITLGTLYQRRYCGSIDWRSGNLVQYVAVTVFFTIGAFLFPSGEVFSVFTVAAVVGVGVFRGPDSGLRVRQRPAGRGRSGQ